MKQVVGLNPGSRVIYNGDGKTRKVSVVSIEKSAYSDEMLLFIQDGNMR